jgi:PAS domain S-box-containing protein
MKDTEKTREQLIQELAQMRQRIAKLESSQVGLEPEAQENEQLGQMLLTSVQEWRTTFDAIHDAVCLLNPQLEVLRCNRAMADLVRRPFDEIIGRTCCELVHGEPQPLGECPTQRARETRRRETIALQVEDRWLSFVADPVLDENGCVVGMVHILADVTERKRAADALEWRNHELALLNQAARACSSSLDPAQVLFVILEETSHLLNVVSSSVWLTDAETGELVCRDATGPYSETLRGWRLVPGEGIVGQVAASGESLIVPDTRVDERHYKRVDQRTGLELRSVIAVPLRVKQNVIGVVEVVDSTPDRFDPTDLQLIESLAATAAAAIENARLYERAQQEIAQRKQAEKEREAVIGELEDALTKVKTLSGLLPICANCKRIRNDQGYWESVEVYVRDHSEAEFSHAICPDCMRALYPGFCEDQTEQ